MALPTFKVLLKKDNSYYPILTGILFLTNELRYNFNYYTGKEIFYLISIIITFCTVTYLTARWFIKDKLKASLVATLFIVINIFYLDIVNIISNIKINKFWLDKYLFGHYEMFFLPFLGLIFISLTTFVLKSKRQFSILNLYLNFIVTVFIVIEISQWIFSSKNEIKVADSFELTNNHNLPIKVKPDIYYIILDSYTSTQSLKKYWNYNNKPFEDSLKNEGFYIAHNSISDYTYTPQCLASYMNFSLLKTDNNEMKNINNLRWLIFNNKITCFLTDQGYTIINYSLFDIQNTDKYYDLFRQYNFLGRTIWYENGSKLIHYIFPSTSLPYTNLNIFKGLNQIHNEIIHKPLFIYAHIMMPHTPFFFDENGNKQSVSTKNVNDKIKYLKQLIYTNKLICKSIKYIISKSANNPIIIIQGDHGFRCLTDVPRNENEKEAHTILNAYYLPNGGNRVLNDSIRPINTFRIILNYYFGQKIPLSRYNFSKHNAANIIDD